MRIGDLIEIRNDQLTLWAQQMVVVADPVTGYFETRELVFKELAPASPDMVANAGFSIKFEGVTRQWCIYRDADSKLMIEKLPTQHEAAHRITTELHPRALSGAA